MPEQQLCSHCRRPFDPVETQIRQGRLNLDRTARKGEFDAYHLACYKALFEAGLGDHTEEAG